MAVDISPATETRIQRLLDATGIQSADELLNIGLDQLEGMSGQDESLKAFRARLGTNSTRLDELLRDGLDDLQAGRLVPGDVAMERARDLVKRHGSQASNGS